MVEVVRARLAARAEGIDGGLDNGGAVAVLRMIGCRRLLAPHVMSANGSFNNADVAVGGSSRAVVSVPRHEMPFLSRYADFDHAFDRIRGSGLRYYNQKSLHNGFCAAYLKAAQSLCCRLRRPAI